MKKFSFKKIDAFATANSCGNPAGYIRLNESSDISPREMQQIAIELKGFVNEVGYVFRTSDYGFSLKYYSSEKEVDFCGHATIAIMYDLAKNDALLQKADRFMITTNRGELEVENRVATEDSVYIMAPEPVESPGIPRIQEIAHSLKLNAGAVETDLPVSVINAGLTTLIVPIKTLDAILGISPDFNALNDFCLKSEIDIVEVYSRAVAGKSNQYRTRVFATRFGYMEDPATGSGNSAFGYYLIKNRMWNDGTITIEQNGLKDRYNLVRLIKKADVNGNIRVYFGGGAVTRITGEYWL